MVVGEEIFCIQLNIIVTNYLSLLNQLVFDNYSVVFFNSCHKKLRHHPTTH